MLEPVREGLRIAVVGFMDNHGWLDIDPPRWWAVLGGGRPRVRSIPLRAAEARLQPSGSGPADPPDAAPFEAR